MLARPGFRWALVISLLIHVVLFLTVPMGGRIGEVRDTAVRKVTKTAVDFVTFVKPPPPPPPP
ncbi:MAG: hypothetical protein GF393_10480, partial [Armatimonadia bacterium]|nr:hypothetical protein [Armatimonadia bacterium]